MKRLLSIILLLICLTGCGKTDIKDRIIVEGIAVDKSDKGFYVTVDSYSSENKSYSSQGDTIYKALQNIVSKTGKSPFYTNCMVIVFSRDVFEYGLSPLLDYIMKNNDIRPDCLLCCTDGKAVDLFENNPRDIAAILEGTRGNYGVCSGETLDVSSRFLENGGDSYLPIISNNEFTGTACFTDKKWICDLKGDMLTGFLLINNFAVTCPISVGFDNSEVSFKISRAKTNIRCVVTGGVPEYTVDIKCEVDLEEISGDRIDLGENDFEKIKSDMEDRLKQIACSAINKSFFDNKCDVFKLEQEVKRRYPDYCKSISDFKNIIPQCTVLYSVDITLNRAGQTNRP